MVAVGRTVAQDGSLLIDNIEKLIAGTVEGNDSKSNDRDQAQSSALGSSFEHSRPQPTREQLV